MLSLLTGQTQMPAGLTMTRGYLLAAASSTLQMDWVGLNSQREMVARTTTLGREVEDAETPRSVSIERDCCYVEPRRTPMPLK